MTAAEPFPSEAPEQTVPFSVRLAARRSIALDPPKQTRERRAHARRRGDDLDWLESVRLIGGPASRVTLVDLSEGGALIEVEGPLRPGLKLTLELSGHGVDASVRLEVLRSYIASLRGGVTYYRGACAFAHLIDLPPEGPGPDTPQSPFVGTDAALKFLLDRAAIRAASPVEPSSLLLDPRQVITVLESLHARGAASEPDALNRSVSELIGAVLPALQRGFSRRDAVAALDCRLKTLPRGAQQQLLATSLRLTALIDRCLPSPPQPEAAPQPALVREPRSQTPVSTDTAFQKIVVRYADGSLAKGFTQDFHPSREQFSLWPSIHARPAERVSVALARLKAIFFVKDFNGNPGYRERKSFTVGGQGRRIEVSFADTEVILGTTLNYRKDAAGFFVVPADPASNNTRIFVVAAAVRGVRFP